MRTAIPGCTVKITVSTLYQCRERIQPIVGPGEGIERNEHSLGADLEYFAHTRTAPKLCCAVKVSVRPLDHPGSRNRTISAPERGERVERAVGAQAEYSAKPG